MDEKELAALRSAHGDVCAARRKGKIIFVVKAITKAKLAEVYDEMDTASGQQKIAQECLLWPEWAEFKKLRDRQPAVVTQAAFAARKVSGANCTVDIDEDAGTAKATVEKHNEADPTLVYEAKALGWAQYQRFLELNVKDRLEAHVLACVDAGTFPVERDERVALFDRWPFLAETMWPFVLGLSGGDLDLEGN